MIRLKKIALAAAFSLALPTLAAADEVTKLKFVTLSPADGPLNTRVLHP